MVARRWLLTTRQLQFLTYHHLKKASLEIYARLVFHLV